MPLAKSFRRLSAGAVVLAVVSVGLVVGGVANAAPAAAAVATTTSLDIIPGSPAPDGTIETLQATVIPTALDNSSLPAGSVQFKDGTSDIGSPVAVAFDRAQTMTTLAHGTHSLTAVFTPTDPTVFGASTSQVQTYIVGATQVMTSTDLTADPPSPAAAGTTETLAATMTPPNATGTLQFKDGDTNIGGPLTVVEGSRSVTTILAPGSHALTAVFTPTDSAAFTASTSPIVTYVVNPAPQATTTSTALALTPTSPAAAGATETLKATLTPSGAVGSVQFNDGPTAIGAPVAVSGGTASTTTILAPGSHALTAVFTPTDSAAFTASTSPIVTYVVKTINGAQATTINIIIALPNPARANLPIFVAALVAPQDPTVNARKLAGTVQFKDGGRPIGGPVRLISIFTKGVKSAGFAFQLIKLPRGTHSLTAVFTPDAPRVFAPATSHTFQLKVNPLF